MYGDLYLDELKHWHITQYRDAMLAQGLHPNSIRKHNNILNAMINMAFKHLDIDRLSPFRGLQIRGEGENTRPIPPITPEKIAKVKSFLIRHNTPASLVGLIQLNTGLRISEPTLARLEDLVLEHEIPHLWVRKNRLTDRKPKPALELCHSLAYHWMQLKSCTLGHYAWTLPGYCLNTRRSLELALVQPSWTRTYGPLNFAVTCLGMHSSTDSKREMTFHCLWLKALRDMDAGKLTLLFTVALATRSSKSYRSFKRLRFNF